MRIAVTADLHWGHDAQGDSASRELVRQVEALSPDLFILAGDVGVHGHWEECLALFSALDAVRLVLPGNHDVWTTQPTPASLDLYERRLPESAARHGFHYLDREPYLAPDGRTAVIGSMNWYDYSFADPALEAEVPGAAAMYPRKLFPRGRHNDGRYVRFGLSDAEFTSRVVDRFRRHLAELPGEVERVVVAQHHPPVRELFYPTPITSVDGRFWMAYTGNRAMQEAVLADPRISHVFCGHTHAACEATVAGKRCLNVGGNYGWKRLLLVDTASGEEQAWEFGRDGVAR